MSSISGRRSFAWYKSWTNNLRKVRHHPLPLFRPLFLLVFWRMILPGLLPRIFAYPAICVRPPNSDVALRMTTLFTTTPMEGPSRDSFEPNLFMRRRVIARTPARHGANTTSIFVSVSLLILNHKLPHFL